MWDITQLSTAYSQSQLQGSIGTALLAKTLDTNQELGEAMTQMIDHSMELSVNPHIGSNFDISV
ncbi:MAG: YjfB family protein [Lachnospiraceae bacterium]|nr:YjfB family protein [Lachnospiraceae bacterium]